MKIPAQQEGGKNSGAVLVIHLQDHQGAEDDDQPKKKILQTFDVDEVGEDVFPEFGIQDRKTEEAAVKEETADQRHGEIDQRITPKNAVQGPPVAFRSQPLFPGKHDKTAAHDTRRHPGHDRTLQKEHHIQAAKIASEFRIPDRIVAADKSKQCDQGPADRDPEDLDQRAGDSIGRDRIHTPWFLTYDPTK